MNTWHFLSVSDDPDAAIALAHSNLSAFYNVIDAYMSSEISTTARVKYYNLRDTLPRTPVLEDEFSLTLATADSLPNEVAICLSYRSEIASGLNAARRRGRLYLGPFSVSALTAGVGDARVHATLRALIAGAAQDLVENMFADGDGAWVVFSPTTAGPEPWDEAALTSASSVVVAGYVDDAFDTVRSRGLDPTARVSWTATF